jgi:hypothetical protein
MKWLRNVIVGSKFKANDTVDGIALTGDHNDGNGRERTYPSGDVKTVLHRKCQIEGDEIDFSRLQYGKDRLRILCFADAIVLRFQTPPEKQPNFGIVVDNEYVGLGHAGAGSHDAQILPFGPTM